VTWELLVVNNNCTDDTDQVISAYLARLPLRRVFEPCRGKSHAANTAVQQATGELILWTDDDVLVDDQWLSEYVAAARAWPNASFWGGTVDARFEGAVPEWIERNVQLLYEPYALAQHGRGTDLLGTRHIVGANMAVRLDVARQYPFNVRLGPSGQQALRGEDTELVGRLRTAGLVGVWVGAARVQHVISNERLNSEYLWHWYAGLGAYTIERHGNAPVPLLMGAPRWAVRQYAGLYLKYACLLPFKNAQWLRTLREAALMRGYIQAAREKSGSPVRATV
jgi:glycosyltransferase involved in cell wall biosynthesis